MRNLDYLSYFYFKNYEEAENNKKGLKVILNTHLLWIIGNNITDYIKGYNFEDSEINIV